MYTKFEKYCWKISLSLVLWSIPQFALAYWFLMNSKFMVNMFYDPAIAILIWSVPSYVIQMAAFAMVDRNMSETEREDFKELYYDYIPGVFSWAPLQFHAASLVLFRLFVIGLIRIIVPKWRYDTPYLINDHSEAI